MRGHHHGMIPVKAAQAVGAIGIDAHFVEHIGADLHFSGFAAQQTDTFIEAYFHIVELGPVFNGSLHIDAVGDIAEGAVEFLLLLLCEALHSGAGRAHSAGTPC